jgi:hypothetical protein
VVDRVIRTIRDAIGLNGSLILSASILKQIEFYYNNTPHNAFENKLTPHQVQNDKELDVWHIRRQDMKLINALKIQQK